MDEKILQLDKNAERCKKLADARLEKNDYLGALGFLFSSLESKIMPETIMAIADVYADMGLLDLSNRYWYKYMFYAPKDKVSVAYEELAINYFYMDNLFASGHFFRKKLEVDGYISKENIDKEVIDFFSGEEYKRHAYRVVYPYDKADFTLEIKNSKRAIALGAFDEAAKMLSEVPEECRDEEIAGDLAVASFMNDDLDGAEKECRRSIKAHGETVTAYCNLSTVYDMKEDADKSEYYYQKALACEKGEQGEAYKLATCAIAREDHITVKRCLETILKDRPEEINMRFFYGINLLNLGEYEKALETFKRAYRTDPFDIIIKYYIDLAISLVSGEGDKNKLLPLKYVKEIPQKIADKWSRKIKELVKSPLKIPMAIKKKETRDILYWGMCYGEEAEMRASVFLLSLIEPKGYTKMVQNVLIDPDIKDTLKRLLIYSMIVKGHRAKTAVVGGGYYVEFTPANVDASKDSNPLYFTAYALCMSKMVFYEVEDFEKIAKFSNEVYKRLKDTVTSAEATNEEVAGLIVTLCEFEKYGTIDCVAEIFGTTVKNIKRLKKIYDDYNKEDKND